jgi:hypothetical protein
MNQAVWPRVISNMTGRAFFPARGAAAIAGLMAMVLCLAGCGRAGQPVSSEPGVIFRDDFSQTTSGWDMHAGADLTTDYDDGRYLIAVEEAGVDVWARPGLMLTDVVFDVETQYAAGPINNEYGVLCRYERGGDGRNSFYFFFISSDGYYALGKVVDDVRTILSPAEGSFQPSDAILLEPEAVNTLTATCVDDQMALAVNGTRVGEFTDDELERGDIGLIAGTFDEGGVRIHFDNVLVRPPS